MDKKFMAFLIISALVFYFSNTLFVSKNNKQNLENNDKKSVIINEKNENNSYKKGISDTKNLKSIKYENNFLKMESINFGGKINELSINRENLKENIVLIDKNIDNGNNFSFDLSVNNFNCELDKKYWDISEVNNGFEYSIKAIDGILVNKRIKIGEKYSGKIEIEVINDSEKPIEIKGAKLNFGPFSNPHNNKADEKQIVVFNDKTVERINQKKKQEILTYSVEKGWIGLKNQYFCFILYNSNGLLRNIEVQRSEDKSLGFSINFPNANIQGKSKITYQIDAYIGPQNYSDLKKTNNKLFKIVDFGVFKFIAVPIYYLLKYLHDMTNNYGFSIILLTIIIRILLWWPTQKSYTSMKKMQSAMNKMQPRLKTIKEIYRDNPQKLNEETMKLYKEYQVNPMGGCLPMLLQMPIFFALYAALANAVELKGSNFIWIWKDLSEKDPIYLLPILMGLSMFIQQKISTPPAATAETAAQQKMMLYLMPIMLTVVSFAWPSGLLLYWIISNVLSIGQQVLINKNA